MTNARYKNKKFSNNVTIKRSNKLVQALNLPTLMNLNPRSLYNKAEEFQTFVKEESVDCIFCSESWEREECTLDEIIKLDGYVTISNPHQRKGRGGRPALFINSDKFHVTNLTQTVIDIPWGVEASWALMTPKDVTNDSYIKNIAVCSFYSKPQSKKKTALLDHICQSFNILSAKYGRGLHFIIAGDSNDLCLKPILQLDPNMRQIVTKPTRMNPLAMLDPIMMTLAQYYQEPECLPPLDPDPGSGGRPSDHLIVVGRPINVINNKPARTFRKVTVRPLPQSGLDKLSEWMRGQDWSEVITETNVDKKAEILQNILLEKINYFLPEKKQDL